MTEKHKPSPVDERALWQREGPALEKAMRELLYGSSKQGLVDMHAAVSRIKSGEAEGPADHASEGDGHREAVARSRRSRKKADGRA